MYSPEVGRRILEEGRDRLQERRDDQYITITSTKPGKPANHLLNEPSSEFLQTLENKLYLKELTQAVLDAVKEYAADTSPVITAHETDWTPHNDEPVWYAEYSEKYKAIGREIKEPRLHELQAFLGKGTVIFNDPRESPERPDGSYESQNDVGSVHSDEHTTYVVENPPIAEQAAYYLSQVTGWRVVSNKKSK